MSTPQEAAALVDKIAAAPTWEARIALIRKVPEKFGVAEHQEIYSAIAIKVYVPNLAPDFAYIHWRDDFELAKVEAAYALAHDGTAGFRDVDADSIAATLRAHPTTARIFRLLLGFTPPELAASTEIVAERLGLVSVNMTRVKSMESGSSGCSDAVARVLATTIVDAMEGALFPPAIGSVRDKINKPDTRDGWKSVRHFADHGVPFATFLHQRHYGGAFRQLLDATSTKRGDQIEDAVQALYASHGINFIRTGSQNQNEIERRFSITIKPAPDFVVFDNGDNVRALLECKGANDGGTARDKAARFRSLRAEAMRLGGIPVFAVLAGLGWTRSADALGPVVRDTDGRVFTLPTLDDMMTVQPFPTLVKPSGAPLA